MSIFTFHISSFQVDSRWRRRSERCRKNHTSPSLIKGPTVAAEKVLDFEVEML